MILVSGANGVVGNPLCMRLASEGLAFKTISRSAAGSIQWDLQEIASDPVLRQLSGFDTLIHCAPIWLLPAHLDQLKEAGFARLIVFSSTSAISKRESLDRQEQLLVTQLVSAEATLQSFCDTFSMALTIFRPSMIYGHGRDQNVMQIAGFIRRFGFFLLVGKAPGLRQPVHADDLVDAALAVRHNRQSMGKVYNLAGAEQLSYRAMVERIFAGLGRKPRILSVPLAIFRIGLHAAAKLSPFSYTAEMANRMSQNLDYDYTPATEDFGFRPQMFLQNPQHDLALNDEAVDL